MYPLSNVLFGQVLNCGAFYVWTVIIYRPALSICLISYYPQLTKHQPSSLPTIIISSRIKSPQCDMQTRDKSQLSSPVPSLPHSLAGVLFLLSKKKNQRESHKLISSPLVQFLLRSYSPSYLTQYS